MNGVRVWPSSGIGTSIASSATSELVTPCYKRFNLSTDPLIVVLTMSGCVNYCDKLPNSPSFVFRGNFEQKDPFSLYVSGTDMINWLKENVVGLDSTESCEKYASRLLQEGLIVQKVDQNLFSRECYYVFGHAVTGT